MKNYFAAELGHQSYRLGFKDSTKSPEVVCPRVERVRHIWETGMEQDLCSRSRP